MYLINVDSLKLEYFVDSKSVPSGYAILSHRWEKEEVLYEDITKEKRRVEIEDLNGWYKVRKFCERAALDGYRYAWVDTCCIDKSSSVELQEAINSMYKWYQNAGRCYAYLSDVSLLCHKHPEALKPPYGSLRFVDSQWFSRGWTLQELLAPSDLIFYDMEWRAIGTRADLAAEIEVATTIPEKIAALGLTAENRPCIADIMAWAGKRITTREEDQAYSLLGLFNVNMPMLYGEGKNAFIRLQQAIMSSSDDQTILAWQRAEVNDDDVSFGLFAKSPADFVAQEPAKNWKFEDPGYLERRKAHAVTNEGVSIEVFMWPLAPKVFAGLLNLRCFNTKSLASGYVGIVLLKLDREDRYAKIMGAAKPDFFDLRGLVFVSPWNYIDMATLRQQITIVHTIRGDENPFLNNNCGFFLDHGAMSYGKELVRGVHDAYELEQDPSGTKFRLRVSKDILTRASEYYGLVGVFEISKVRDPSSGVIRSINPFYLFFGFDFKFSPLIVILPNNREYWSYDPGRISYKYSSPPFKQESASFRKLGPIKAIRLINGEWSQAVGPGVAIRMIDNQSTMYVRLLAHEKTTTPILLSMVLWGHFSEGLWMLECSQDDDHLRVWRWNQS